MRVRAHSRTPQNIRKCIQTEYFSPSRAATIQSVVRLAYFNRQLGFGPRCSRKQYRDCIQPLCVRKAIVNQLTVTPPSSTSLISSQNLALQTARICVERRRKSVLGLKDQRKKLENQCTFCCTGTVSVLVHSISANTIRHGRRNVSLLQMLNYQYSNIPSENST